MVRMVIQSWVAQVARTPAEQCRGHRLPTPQTLALVLLTTLHSLPLPAAVATLLRLHLPGPATALGSPWAGSLVASRGAPTPAHFVLAVLPLLEAP